VRARRWWGWVLVPVYAVGLAVKDGLRRLGVLRTRGLAWPVVSVGSLSAGGAGKTPVVIALVELLQRRGWGMDVLSRGYGRSGGGVELVDVSASDAAGRFGDEPVVIARRTGVGVWVGGDRFAAGVMAEKSVKGLEAGSSASLRNDKQKSGQRQEQGQGQGQGQGQRQERNTGVLRFAQNDDSGGNSNGWLHLLDDGFQHRGLGRAVDVVLVTEEDLEDAMLPAGNRREPLRALRRADVVVLREEERGRIEERVRRWMRGDAAVWCVRRTLAFAGERGESESQRAQSKRESTEGASVGGGMGTGTVPVELLGGLRVVGFCAIARPENFVRMVREAGVEAVEVVTFADHHAYMGGDVERLVKVAGECGAEGFVTTEKDAVKLSAEMRDRLEAVGPVHVARLDVTFVDEAEVVRELERRLG
jgi:tetraacyldisaccharide 4'-kinase